MAFDAASWPLHEHLLSRRNALSILALGYPMTMAVTREWAWPGGGISAEALGKLVPSLGQPSHDRLLRVLNDRRLRGQIPAREVEFILASEHRSLDELMIQLLPIAQLRSHPPLSNYRVGILARGTSGSLYLGANLEVPGQCLGFAVHGEQSAVANAFMHGDGGITAIALTAAPCGHCRQFLNELQNAKDLDVFIKGSVPTRLGALLPQAFGPDNLAVKERLFSGGTAEIRLTRAADDLATAALEAASRSYAPYTRAYSGIAARSSTGVVYQGSYLENAAFNPSLSPLQAALVGVIMGGEQPDDMRDAVLVELENASISQLSATRAVLEALAPQVSLRRVAARLK